MDKHEINTGLSLIPVRFLRTIGSADAYIESRERLQLRLPSAAYLQRFFLHAVTSYSGNPNNTSDLINILPGRAVRPENQRLDYEAFDLYSLVSTGQPWNTTSQVTDSPAQLWCDKGSRVRFRKTSLSFLDHHTINGLPLNVIPIVS